MNVTCERCSTEYEFEETLVSHRGTTVKCTSCGHLFKIYRPGPSPGADSAKPWMLRRSDGDVEPLASLGELARMIATGKTGPDDEISRGGLGWKRLGDIHELATFFPHAGSLDAEPPRRARATPTFGLETRTGASGQAPDAQHRPPDEETTVAEEKPVARAEHRHPQQPENADEVRTRGKAPSSRASRMPPHPWLELGVLLGIALAAFGGWLVWSLQEDDAPPTQADIPQVEPASQLPRAEAFLKKADAALASDLEERFDEALLEYAKALALRDDDPHILASLSRVHALWAQSLRDAAYAARNDGSRSGRRPPHTSPEQTRHARQAEHHATQAVAQGADHAEAHVALADAKRLLGELDEARAHMKRALATSAEPTAEALRVQAWLAIDTAEGDLAAGTELAERAVRRAPDMLRVRKLLARCLIAEGALDDARRHLQAVRQRDPDHAPAVALLQRIAEISKPHSANAPQPRRAPARADEPPRVEPVAHHANRPSAAPADPSPGSQGSQPEPPVTYDGLVSEAERLLEGGRVLQAKDYYRRALEKRAGAPEALTGLGYIALERGAPQAALARFKQASAKHHADAFLGLGETFRRLGRKDDALRAYERYLEIEPQGRGASVARHQLGRLQDAREGDPSYQPKAQGRTP